MIVYYNISQQILQHFAYRLQNVTVCLNCTIRSPHMQAIDEWYILPLEGERTADAEASAVLGKQC